MLQGLSPNEQAINRIEVVEGDTISSSRELLLGQIMARALNRKVGETIELIGTRYKIVGIFETGDLVGLDVTYGALMAVYRETGDPAFFPPLLLRRKVKAGHLGRKTGRGWYIYDQDGKRIE